MFRYLTQQEIKKRCNENSVIRDGYKVFAEKNPSLKYRITDLFSNCSFVKGIWICYIKYEINYQIYEESIEVE